MKEFYCADCLSYFSEENPMTVSRTVLNNTTADYYEAVRYEVVCPLCLSVLTLTEISDKEPTHV